MRNWVVGISLALLTATPTMAAPDDAEVFILSGLCTKLQIGKYDFTKACDQEIVSFTTADGRVGFVFTFGEGVLQFSGNGKAQTTLAGIRVSQPIDRMRFTLSETAPGAATSTTATGTCTYGDPFDGVTSISCRVTADGMPQVAEFLTDGSKPVSRPFTR